MTAPTELSELEQGGGAGGRRVALSCLIITLVAPRTLTSHQVSTISCKITTLPGLISLKQYFYSHFIVIVIDSFTTHHCWTLVTGLRSEVGQHRGHHCSNVCITDDTHPSRVETNSGHQYSSKTSVQLSTDCTTQSSPLIGRHHAIPASDWWVGDHMMTARHDNLDCWVDF